MAKYLLNKIRVTAKPRTVERKLTAYRSFGRWAGWSGFMADYKAPRSQPAIAHPLPEGIDGIHRMIDACENDWRYKALVALTGYCGLRVSEARSITPLHIDPVEKMLTVRGKGDVTREVPISSHAWPIIAEAARRVEDYQALVGLSDRQARSVFTKLGAKAGLARTVKSHDGRATLATSAHDKTKDLVAVQQILGHASIRTTQRYVGTTVRAMRDAVEV